MQTPQSEAGCAGIARARRRGHLAESARPWRCAARGGAISLRALRQDTPRSEVYLTSCSRKKEFFFLEKIRTGPDRAGQGRTRKTDKKGSSERQSKRCEGVCGREFLL